MATTDKTSEQSSMTRRRVVGGAGLGLASVAASSAPALAQGNVPMAAQDLQDPRTKYPKPPFKKQSQTWPGLASQMDPVPDHGEKS